MLAAPGAAGATGANGAPGAPGGDGAAGNLPLSGAGGTSPAGQPYAGDSGVFVGDGAGGAAGDATPGSVVEVTRPSHPRPAVCESADVLGGPASVVSG